MYASFAEVARRMSAREGLQTRDEDSGELPSAALGCSDSVNAGAGRRRQTSRVVPPRPRHSADLAAESANAGPRSRTAPPLSAEGWRGSAAGGRTENSTEDQTRGGLANSEVQNLPTGPGGEQKT